MLSRAKKAELALAVICNAANLFEDWSQTIEGCTELDHSDYEEARKLVTKWMAKLPGDGWDLRLPEPE